MKCDWSCGEGSAVRRRRRAHAPLVLELLGDIRSIYRPEVLNSDSVHLVLGRNRRRVFDDRPELLDRLPWFFGQMCDRRLREADGPLCMHRSEGSCDRLDDAGEIRLSARESGPSKGLADRANERGWPTSDNADIALCSEVEDPDSLRLGHLICERVEHREGGFLVHIRQQDVRQPDERVRIPIESRLSDVDEDVFSAFGKSFYGHVDERVELHAIFRRDDDRNDPAVSRLSNNLLQEALHRFALHGRL